VGQKTFGPNRSLLIRSSDTGNAAIRRTIAQVLGLSDVALAVRNLPVSVLQTLDLLDEATQQLIGGGSEIDDTASDTLNLIQAITGIADFPRSASDAISFTSTAVGTRQSSLLTNLISHWKLDEASGTRNDSHGTNHLTDENTVTQTTGKLTSAAQFTAANSERLIVADNASVSTGDINFSMAGWFYVDSLAAQRTLASHMGALTNRTFNLYINTSGRLTFDVYSTSALVGQARTNGGTVTTGSWHFCYVEHDATNNQASVSLNNGSLITVSTSAALGDCDRDFRIGAAEVSNVPAQFMDGRMDGWSLWKRLLTSDERTALYNSGNGLEYPF
jgi:hypothetical protein